jgi:hypothetical protein
MFGLFKREKTMGEVAKDFTKQYDIVRIVFFNYFTETAINAFQKQGASITDDDAATYAAAIVTYLSGEDLEEWANKLDKKQKIVANAVLPGLKEQVDGVLALDKSLREAVVYTLRMKNIVKSYVEHPEHPSDYLLKTADGKRISLILTQYGGEFPKEPTPDGFKKLIYGLMVTDKMRQKKK